MNIELTNITPLRQPMTIIHLEGEPVKEFATIEFQGQFTKLSDIQIGQMSFDEKSARFQCQSQYLRGKRQNINNQIFVFQKFDDDENNIFECVGKVVEKITFFEMPDFYE